jgi:Tol biopolymer transport system component
MTTGGAKPGQATGPLEGKDRLDSWKEIASYLRRGVRTVTRWEREQGLPVHRSKTGTVYAYKSELDVWWSSQGQQIEREPSAKSAPQASWLRRFRLPVAALALGLIVILAALVLHLAPRPEPRLVPLTTLPGREGPPSLSPDGNQVAFHKDGDIFVKPVDGEALLQLTHTPDTDGAPAWSPDGRHIAFVRNASGIYLISPLGGGERKIAETHMAPEPYLEMMAWTVDSRSLIISERTSQVSRSLVRVSIETGRKEQITRPPPSGLGDHWPIVSPDGQTLAFARALQDTSATVYRMPLFGGPPSQITTEDGHQLWGLTWTPDGREVIYSSDRTGQPRLWRVAARSSSAGPPSLVTGAGENARFPSFSRLETRAPVRMAYQRFEYDSDLRRAEIVGEGTPRHALKPSSPFLASTKEEGSPSFSRDGKKIAFRSNRAGAVEIWLCDSDGSNVVRLASPKGLYPIAPRWSPDGNRIAFFALGGPLGLYQNYVVDVGGGLPRLLSSTARQRVDLHHEASPSWSLDGHWIYFGSGRLGNAHIWKVASGGGEPIQLTKNEGAEAFESPGGRLYFARPPGDEPGVWSMPVEGGDEIRVLDSARFGFWAVVQQGIYFVDFNAASDATKPVKFYSFQTRQTTEIGTMEWNGPAQSTGIAVSPDSHWFLYSSVKSVEADLMLLENFR